MKKLSITIAILEDQAPPISVTATKVVTAKELQACLLELSQKLLNDLAALIAKQCKTKF
jgi:hypothetical protein